MAKVKLSKTRAHQIYKKSDGSTVPGASTISKIGEDQGALIHWAWKMGMEKKDYKKLTGRAADIGTVAHFLISCFLKGDEPDLGEFAGDDIEKANKVFEKFKVTWENEGLEYVANEIELVSELGFGGTIDIIARDRKKNLVLVDEKSSPRLYGSFYRQISAYEHLYNENHPEDITRRAFFRHGKDDPEDVEVRWLGGMDKHFNIFLKQLDLFYAFKTL